MCCQFCIWCNLILTSVSGFRSLLSPIAILLLCLSYHKHPYKNAYVLFSLSTYFQFLSFSSVPLQFSILNKLDLLISYRCGSVAFFAYLVMLFSTTIILCLHPICPLSLFFLVIYSLFVSLLGGISHIQSTTYLFFCTNTPPKYFPSIKYVPMDCYVW